MRSCSTTHCRLLATHSITACQHAERTACTERLAGGVLACQPMNTACRTLCFLVPVSLRPRWRRLRQGSVHASQHMVGTAQREFNDKMACEGRVVAQLSAATGPCTVYHTTRLNIIAEATHLCEGSAAHGKLLLGCCLQARPEDTSRCALALCAPCGKGCASRISASATAGAVHAATMAADWS